jgi:hypothetical protein
MSDPFRSELEAAHQRIEQLERENKTRVAELERENARLRARLVDAAPPSRSKTGKTFFAIAMMTLGVSLVAGMFFARIARMPEPTPVWASPSLELTDTPGTDPAPIDFDKEDVADALNAVPLDCLPKGTSGHARITFEPSGAVSLVTVDRPLGNNVLATCVEQRYRQARIAPFTGPPRVVGKSFTAK